MQPVWRIWIMSSLHGLILFSISNDIWAIWNPSTTDYRRLPRLDVRSKILGFGLGYDCGALDYKAVRISPHYDFISRRWVRTTHVYSLKLGSWKMIEDFPYNPLPDQEGACVHGALHWTAITTSRSSMIVALHLGTESYRQLPLPPPPVSTPNHFFKRLVQLGGCLAVSYYYGMQSMDVWVMKDYGVENSWTKLFSFEDFDFDLGSVRPKPIAYLPSKGQLILYAGSNMIIYCHVDNHSANKVEIHFEDKNHTASLNFLICRMCPESLFRFNDSAAAAAAASAAKKHGVSARARERLKFSITTTDVRCRRDSTSDSIKGET